MADLNAVLVVLELIPHFVEHAELRERFSITHLPWWSDQWGNPGSMGRDKVHQFVTTSTTRGNRHTKASLYRSQNRVKKLLEGQDTLEAFRLITDNVRNENLEEFKVEIALLSSQLVEIRDELRKILKK